MKSQMITMPQLGESVTEGTIERWLVKPGDVVKKYDPLAEVSTDKVNAEIPSSFEGIIQELLVREGDTVAVGVQVCSIEVKTAPATSSSATQGSSISATLSNVVPPKPAEVKPASPKPKTEKREKPVGRFSPAVLSLASEHQIDLSGVKGSGLGGRITRKDIEKLIEQGKTGSIEEATKQQLANIATSENLASPRPKSYEPATIVTTGDIEIPVTGVRRAIANNMVRAKQEVPHAWMMVEADVTKLVKYRDSIKDEFKKKEGYNITYFAFFAKAVAQAIREFPMMNSQWAQDKIIQKKDIHLSIAVATDDALYVPVIKHVDEKSIKGIAREIHDLAQLVRTGKLKQEHMQGGTFTLNNTGTFGSIQSAGILNYPQAAILQVESIVKRPVIIQDNMFAARDMVNLCLSLDHRVLDGFICGKFLQRVKQLLEAMDEKTLSIY